MLRHTSMVTFTIAAALGGELIRSAEANPTPRSDVVVLDELVVSATGTARQLADAPGAVEIITAREIADMNALTIAEALDTALGVTIAQESGRVRVANIRGARSKHTLVLLDGRRLSYGFNDQIDLQQIPTVMVERIEIVRGPASALYGSDALGGVINIITKTPPETWSGMVQGQMGMHHDGGGKTFVGSGVVGGPLDRVRVLLSGEWRDHEGWDQTRALPDDGFAQQPSFLAGRVVFDLNAQHTLSAGLEYMDNATSGGQFYENLARERDANEERRGYYLQYDGQLTDNDQLMLRLNRSEYQHQMRFRPLAASGVRDTDQATTQIEARYHRLMRSQHLLTVGAEYRSDRVDNRIAGEHTQEDVENISLLVQNEFDLLDPLYVVLGLRYDHHSTFGDQWSPRASFIYGITDQLRLKGSIGQGFRAPSLTELYVTSMRRRGREVFAANSDLKPEQSTSYELGLEGEYGRYRAGLTGFYTDIDNLIESIFQHSEGQGQNRRDLYQYQNIAQATLKGLEVEGGVQLTPQLAFDGNLTWMESEDKTRGGDIGGLPKYKGALKLSYALPTWQLRGHLRMTYLGEMTYADGERHSYPLFSAYLNRSLNNSVALFAGIDNLLDKRIERNNVSVIEPARFYVGATAQF